MTLFFQTLKWLLFITILLAAFIGLLDYMDVSFKSDKARLVLLEELKTYTGRDVAIDGDVYLTISLSPRLLVERIHIKNVPGFDIEDFITVSEAHVEVTLLPLLSGILRLDEISANHANINLIRKDETSHNWSFDNVAWVTEITSGETKDDPEKQGMTQRLSLGEFNLTDVTILYKDESQGHHIEKNFERLRLDVDDTAKPQAEILGSIQGHTYQLNFEADPLVTLSTGQPWFLHGTGTISGSKTTLDASIELAENTLNSKININAENVNLGLILEKLGVIKDQDAAAKKININAKLHGSNLTELYQQAEIELQLLSGHWRLISPGADHKSDQTSNQGKLLTFNKISSFASWMKPVELYLDGKITGKAVNLEFKTNRLLDFFDDVHKLDVDLKATVADIDARLKGTLDLPIKNRQFLLDISLKGKNLEKINPLIEADLPAFNDFSLTGKLTANNKGYILRSADASIGDSHFKTSIVIETALAKPFWTINIHSHQLQLNDFAFDISDLQLPQQTTPKTLIQNIDDLIALQPVRRLIEMLQSPKMHFNLNLTADKIYSGEGIIGKTKFQFQLDDNAMSLTNAAIELPSGSATASARIELMNNMISGNAKLNIDKLDYGIIARTFNPDAELDGVLSSNVDLEFDSNKVLNLLDYADGQIDIVIWPKNTKPAKILDLWATNLYLILLPELNKKDAKVNCLVGLMTLKDGIMKEDFFAIDTTKLWIQGDFNVDFKQKEIVLSLFPRSKTARFFAIQSPIRASGSFSDISLDLNLLDLGVSYTAFVTSPLHVPVRRVFDGAPPDDGSAICEKFFDRQHVEWLHSESKRKQQEEIDEILDSDY